MSESLSIRNFRDLMGDAKVASIKNLLDGEVVRKLMVEGENVVVDALIDKVVVPLDTVVIYDPWFMDRGSLLFAMPGGELGKICTERDVLVRDNSMAEFSIVPAEGVQEYKGHEQN